MQPLAALPVRKTGNLAFEDGQRLGQRPGHEPQTAVAHETISVCRLEARAY
jgi:hypothetical protein